MMPAVSVIAPHTNVPNVDGTALESGYAYIGEAGYNAETNRIQAYWDEELTILAQQPIRTINGFFARDGDVADVFVNANDYSVLIKNRNQVTIVDKRNYNLRLPFTSFEYSPLGIEGAVSRQITDKLSEIVSIKDIGAIGDGVEADTDVFTAAEASPESEYYLPPGVYPVTSVDLQKNYWGPGVIRLNGNLVPQILNAHRPRMVVCFPPVVNVSNVLLPDGTWLDVTASTTQGLQEAITAAFGDGSPASGSYDLMIVGKQDDIEGDSVDFTCTTALTTPPMEGRKLIAGGVKIGFTSAIAANNALTINSGKNGGIFAQSMQLVSAGTGRVVHVEPSTALPVDGAAKLDNFRVVIGSAVNTNSSTTGQAGAILGIAPGAVGLLGSKIKIGYANQQGTDVGSVIAWIDQPTSGGLMKYCEVEITRFEGAGNAGFIVGTGSDASTRIVDNKFKFSGEGMGQAGSRFIDTWGSANSYEIATRGNGFAVAIRVQAPCIRNTFYAKSLEALTTVIENFESNRGSNRLFRASDGVVQTVALGATPAWYHNTSMEDQNVLISGGSFSGNTLLSYDGGTTTYDTTTDPAILRSFHLKAGMSIRVNYFTTPNFFVFRD